MTASAGPGTTRRSWLLLFLIVLAGLALRLYRLDWQSLWNDELFSTWTSGLNLTAMFQAIIRDFVNPPLHYLLLHYWMRLFGWGEISVRLPSVIAGTVTVAMTYPVARRLVDANTALVATLLTSISQIAIEYSQEARAYSLALMFCVLCIWFWLETRRTKSWGYWWLFIACSVLLVYTHYYAVSILIALALWTLLDYRTEPIPWAKWGVLLATGTLAYLPWLIPGIIDAFRSIHRISLNPGSLMVVHWFSPLSILNRFNSAKWEGLGDRNTHLLVSVAGALLFLAPALLAVATSFPPLDGTLARIANRPASRRNIALLTVLWIVALVMPMVFGRLASVQFAPRYSFFAVVPYYILAAAGICSLRSTWMKGALLVCICLFSASALRSNYFLPDKAAYRQTVHFMLANYQPGDCIVFSPDGQAGFPLYWKHYDREGPPIRSFTLGWDPLPAPGACNRLWLLWDDTPWKFNPAIPHAGVVAKLSAGYVPLPETKRQWISTQLFTNPRLP